MVICCWTADGSGLWMMMMDVVGVLMRLMGGHLVRGGSIMSAHTQTYIGISRITGRCY